MGIDDLNLRHLRSIAALAEELNFGKAADRIGISQPALTRVVADVEEATGARLFERTTRRVALTPVGAVFVAEAKAVLARMDEAMRQVGEAVRRQAATVRLEYTPLAGLTVLPGVLAAWDSTGQVHLVEANESGSADQRSALVEGRADIVLTDEVFRGDEYRCVCLHREPLAVVLAAAHPLSGRVSVRLKELRGDTFLLYPRADYPEYYDRFFSACAAAGFAPKIRCHAVGVDLLDSVLDGGGILFTPADHTPIDLPEVRFVSLESPLPLYAEVWAVWLESRTSPRLTAALETVESLRVPK